MNKKIIARQKIWFTLVIAVNAALWLIPSDVVEQIARDRQTMLGRYSRNHFTWIVAVTLISAVSFYIDWSGPAAYKKRWFQVLAILLFLVPTLTVVDFLARGPAVSHYVQDRLAYHRPVNGEFAFEFTDRPVAHRTYPNAPSGYGTIKGIGRTDQRGYRNSTHLKQYDVVVLGDSFAEGSSVLDEQAWPVLLSRQSGLTVYNLGMSGYAPLHYLESLKDHGLSLQPRVVVCLLYEGNDFRSAKSDRKLQTTGFSRHLKRYFKQSPIVQGIDQFLIDTFGPIHAAGNVKGIEVLDWLPLTIPPGVEGKPYVIKPKQLRDGFVDPLDFALDRHWLNPRKQIAEIRSQCENAGSTFVLAYAPAKAQVVLPLVADTLPAEKVRAFMRFRYKGTLPEPEVFLPMLIERLSARETVVAQWCAKESIPMISLTPALRAAALSGTQVYFTYDQHWTPDGHEVVALEIKKFLANRGISTRPISMETSNDNPPA